MLQHCQHFTNLAFCCCCVWPCLGVVSSPVNFANFSFNSFVTNISYHLASLFFSKSPFWDSRLSCDYKMATLPSIKVLQSCVDPGMGISVCPQVLCWPHQGHQYRSFSIVLTMSRTSVYVLKSCSYHLKGISVGPLVLCWPCQGRQCMSLGLAVTTSKA